MKVVETTPGISEGQEQEKLVQLAVDASYENWGSRAVDEALLAGGVTDVNDGLKKTAGGAPW